MEDLIEVKAIVIREEEVPNVTNNPLSAHNNGPVIRIICDDREFFLAFKTIITIATTKDKPKIVAKSKKKATFVERFEEIR